MTYQNLYHLTTVPEYVTQTKETENDKTVVKWSGKNPPPAIGTRVNIWMNSFGAATVTGYFVEHGYLGVYVELDVVPAWLQKQCPGNPRPMIFGAELERK